MTTIDHHPYLVDGDLRTAEDVLELVKFERARAALELRGKLRVLAGEQVPYGEAFMVAMVAFERVLRLRLDRERRQACRRGALERWRRVRSLVRWAREAPIVRAIDWRWGEVGNSVWWMLRDCLAFRAAARAR